jgi:hypothetical protein
MLKDSKHFTAAWRPSVTHKSTIFKRQLFITLCGISVVKTSYVRYTFKFFLFVQYVSLYFNTATLPEKDQAI